MGVRECSTTRRRFATTTRPSLTHTFRRASRLQHRVASCTLPSPDDASPSCRAFNVVVWGLLGFGSWRLPRLWGAVGGCVAWGRWYTYMYGGVGRRGRGRHELLTRRTLRTYLTRLLKIEKTSSPHFQHRRSSPPISHWDMSHARAAPVHIRMPSRLGPPHANQ